MLPRWPATAFVVMVLLATPAAVSKAAEEESSGPAILEVVTRHFRVITDLGEASGSSIAEELEAAYAVMWQRFFRTGRDPELRAVFFVTRDGALWSTVTGAENRPDIRGYLARDPLLPVVATSLQGRTPLRPVVHELGHLFIDQYAPFRPFWVSEGLAEYLSTVELDADTIRLGKVPAERAAILTNNPLRPPHDLLSLTREDLDTPRTTDFAYAQAWAWVHFLIHGAAEQDRTGFERYLASLTQHPDAKLESFTESSLRKLGNDFRFYVKKGLYRFRKLERGDLPLGKVTSVRRLSAEDGQATLAYYVLRRGEPEAASRLLSGRSSHPLGALAEAELARAEGRIEDALRAVEHGLTESPDDLYLRVERARLLTHPDVDSARDPDRELSEVLAEAPWLAAAAHERAKIALAEGDPHRALAFARRAIALRGGEAIFYFTLADALRRTGNVRGAIEVATRALPLARGPALRKLMEDHLELMRREVEEDEPVLPR